MLFQILVSNDISRRLSFHKQSGYPLNDLIAYYTVSWYYSPILQY